MGRRVRQIPASPWVAFLLLAALALLPSTALAKGRRPARHAAPGHAAQKRLAITSSEGGGPAEGPVRAQIARILAKAKIKALPQKKGTAPSEDQQWLALGQKLKVDGFVQLSFASERGKQSVDISVRTASDGASLGTETFTAHGSPGRLAAVVAKGFWKKLGSAVKLTAPAQAGDTMGMPPRDLAHEEGAKPETPSEPETPPDTTTPEPTPTPEPEATERPEKKVVRPPVRRRPPAEEAPPEQAKEHHLPGLVAVAQLRYLHRSFTYVAPMPIAGASLNSPTVGLEVAWFPLTNFGISAGGDFEKWFKLVKVFPTTMLDVHGSLVFRLPLSFGDLRVQAGVFRHSFSVTDDGSGQRPNVSLPDTTYFGIRGGAGLDVRLGEGLSLMVDANYRLVTSLGAGSYGVKSAIYFPNAKAGVAFDAGLALAYHLNRMFAVALGGDVRRYAITTNATADDRIDATSAADTYLAGWVGVAGTFQ